MYSKIFLRNKRNTYSPTGLWPCIEWKRATSNSAFHFTSSSSPCDMPASTRQVPSPCVLKPNSCCRRATLAWLVSCARAGPDEQIREESYDTRLSRGTSRQQCVCRFECLTASIAVMSGKELPKVADAEKESHYGYVFGVSGPGEDILNTYKCIIILGRSLWSEPIQPASSQILQVMTTNGQCIYFFCHSVVPLGTPATISYMRQLKGVS